MALGLVLVVALVQGSALRDVWTIDPDAAAYVGLGRALAAGDGYVLDGIPHAKYPPGLPLLLSLAFRLEGPQAWLLAHQLLVACLALAAVASWRLARRLGAPPGAAAAVGLTVALSQTLFDLSVRYLRSEVPFLLATVTAFLVLRAALAPGGRTGRALLAGLLCALALSLRLAGVTLLVVPALHLLAPADEHGGRRRALLTLVLGLAGLGGWMAWGAHVQASVPDAPDYGSELVAAEPRDLTKIVRADMPTLDGAGALRRLTGNLTVLARACGVLLSNDTRSEASLPLGAAALALIGAGLLLMLRRERHPAQHLDAEALTDPPAPADDHLHAGARRDAVLYVLATLALYLAWPFNQKHRFYVPLLPFLLVAAGHGAAWLLTLARGLTMGRAGRVVLVLLGLAATAALASRRSDQATVLGRWSTSYAALVVGAGATTLALAGWLWRRPLPGPEPRQAWLLPALFALTLADDRLQLWPAQVRAHAERAATRPADDLLASIDVHPLLGEVARWLADQPADTVLMTDVPKMMTAMTGRRCVPFVYRLEPPAVLTGEADLVFYTGELPEAAQVLDARAHDFDVALRLDPISEGGATVVPTVYAVRP